MGSLATHLLDRRHALPGVALLRFGLSSLMVVYYALHFRERAVLWGPAGILDWQTYTAMHPNWLELYRLTPSPFFAEAMFWASLAVAAANVLGRWPRTTGFLFAITTYATLQRNALAMDGGQELLVILAFYLCLSDCGQYFSWKKPRSATPRAPRLEALTTAIHNVAVFSIAAQICILYFWTGFYKVAGPMWRDGSALYYILRDDRFTLPGVSQLIYDQPVLVTLGTYATLVFQLSFPTLMWVRRAKPYLIATALVFHTGIAILMGLAMFSAIMIVADLSLLSDAHILAVGRFVRRLLPRSVTGAAPMAAHPTGVPS